ncbi:hypothetical protein DMENIID0001_167180 [Sergentomyia squamirostris]
MKTTKERVKHHQEILLPLFNMAFIITIDKRPNGNLSFGCDGWGVNGITLCSEIEVISSHLASLKRSHQIRPPELLPLD